MKNSVHREPTNFYVIQNEIPPWGDYGDILFKGLIEYDYVSDSRQIQAISVSRTGPYVPPLIVDFELIITESTKAKFEKSDLKGLSYLPVKQKKIVRLDWSDWNMKSDYPPILPKSNKPEDYIKRRKHDIGTASCMPNLWMINLSVGGSVIKVSTNKSKTIGFSMLSNSWNGSDIFHVEDVLWVIVSEKGRQWIEANVSKKMSFKQILSE